MKKVLIYLDKNKIKPTGGPYGYTYNLMSGIDKLNNKDYKFYYLEKPVVNNTKSSKLKKHLPKFINNLIISYLNIKNLKNQISYSDDIDLKKYDIVHFHSTFDLYKCRKALENYKGKVLLTSHSPQPAHQEVIESIVNFRKHIIKKYLKELENIDKYAFERADVVIFPCEEAEEPYYNRWKEYKKIHESIKNKIKYMPSGILQCTAKVDSKTVREKYGIPNNAFLISYVGRHNQIKGYDVLKEIGSKILDKKEVYMIIAGSEGPLYHLENKKWIEVGWTNDPHSIIAASNLFILPNRETYFDLVFLEVLSLGVPLLVSNTGGNKYFKKYKSTAIYYFNTVKDAVKEINSIMKIEKKEIEKSKKKNINLFNKTFNDKEFANRYIELLGMLNEK